MKKNMYIAPNCEVVEMETVAVLAASLNVGVGDNVKEDFTEDANRHRGEWGNLWDKR